MLRANLADLDENGQRGDWCFTSDGTYIVIRFGPDPMLDVVACCIDGSSSKAWRWNGSKEAPTLTPSILVYGNKGEPNRWHGFIENGVLRDA